MSTIEQHDHNVLLEWTRIFKFSRSNGQSVDEAMNSASAFIREEYDIVHPEMFGG